MNLVKSLSRIKDFRRGEGRRYPLIVILLITIMSIMSGRCRYREIARFADANKKELLKFFKLNRDRLPSHVTFREVIRGVNFEEVTAAFENWASQYVVIEPGECLAIDGKAIASTMTDYTKSYQNFVSMVSVFSHKRGQVVKTVKMESSKISEISVVQQLIEALDLKDVIFTLDALHCQKKNISCHRQKRKRLYCSG